MSKICQTLRDAGEMKMMANVSNIIAISRQSIPQSLLFKDGGGVGVMTVRGGNFGISIQRS